VVLGELVPKSLALQRTEKTVLWCARPLKWSVTLLRPLIWSLNGVGNLTLKLIGLQGGEGHHTAVHSVNELGILLEQSRKAGVIDRKEHAIVERGLQFGEHVAREAMIPRLDIVALDLNRPVPELLQEITAKDHTRLPCFEESVDKIIGVLNIRRLLPQLIAGEPVTDLRPLLRDPVVVPESQNLEQVFEAFRESGAEMAVVVDEFGGTAGIITLEDVIEEVFGEVDAADDPVRRDDDGVAHIRGDARLYEVNAALNWELADDQYDTIGGYVVGKLGRTAEEGDEVDAPNGTKLRVHETDQHRIKILLLIEPPASAEQPAS
jgi:CBS domain containing-hemolysin-like protein